MSEPRPPIIFVDPLPGFAASSLGAAARAGAIVRGGPPGARLLMPEDPDAIGSGDHVVRDAPTERVRDEARAAGATLWARCGHPRDVAAAARLGVGAWLTGYEQGGPASPSTALVLIRAASRVGVPWVAVGLGRRARGASAAVGAAGVLLDAATWCLPDAPIGARARARVLAARSGRDTEVIGELCGRPVRVLARGSVGARAALRDAAEPRVGFDALAASWWTTEDGVIPAPQNIGDASRFAGMSDLAALVADERASLAAAVVFARAHHPLRTDPFGVGTLVVQGPMANVAERAGLVKAVRAAGALPFVALGARAPHQAEQVLAAASSSSDVWGAGLIGFDDQPHRASHIEAINNKHARYVIIAGGSAQLGAEVEGARPGPTARVWLHVPSARLIGPAVAAGVRGFVLEGHEAGGHVGALSSVGLWEEGIASVEDLAQVVECTVILAGGIGCATSAAFAGAIAAPIAASGARVGLQAGTAFLLTHDVVECGQLSPTGQRVLLEADDTVLVGGTAGVPLRCAPNAFTAERRAVERDLAQRLVDVAARRAAFERLNVGRTRIAAQGIERDPTWSPGDDDARRYRPVSAERQRAEGAHTAGQGITLTHDLCTVRELVHELSIGAARRLEGASATTAWERPSSAHPLTPRAPRRAAARAADPHAPIAIVGVGCVTPLGLDVASSWAALLAGEDGIREIPAHRWDPDLYWDPATGPRGPIMSRARVAGWIGPFGFDPVRYRIPPRVAETLDRAQQLALVAAEEAITRWGAAARVRPDRAAVLLGNSMGGENAKTLAVRVRSRELLAHLRRDPSLAWLPPEEWSRLLDRAEADLAARFPPLNANSMAGLLANVIAGRIASWLDWHGGNAIVDAACASTLAAITMAIDQLRARRVDVVVTGGVDADLSPETHVAFSLTGAMSAGASRPFNADADGFVMGEGAAMFVLRRLDDALADGDPIWAIVRGVGQSSDGRGPGITAPSEHGQALAIRRAWEEAGAPTRRASMIEAHGTGTQVGDRAEGAVLNTLFGGGDHPVWVGSIKSNIGHLKGAAGAVGLFKAVLALATGVIPPTLHAGPIRADVPAGALRFPRRPTSLAGSPRVAGVSAFGFGGTNYHLVVEQAPPDARRPGWLDEATRLAEAAAAPADDAAWRHDAGEDPPADTKDAAPRVTAWSSTTADDDARTLRGPSASIGSAAAAPRRLVLCAWPSVFAQRRDAWVEAASTGAPLPPGAIVGVGSPARLVWAFPGQGSVRPGAVRVARGYEAAARVLEAIEQHLPDAFAAAGVTGLAPRLGALEGRDPASPPGPLRQHVVLYALGAAWARQLSEDGVPMAAAVGHSVGEIAALHAAGALDLIDGLRLVVARGAALEACPEGAMLAVSGPPEVVAAVLPLGVSLAAVNGPRAVVLSGPPEAIEAAQQALTAAGSRCVPLAVTRAYHGPLVDAAKQRLIDALDSCSFHEPGVPVLSGYHAAPFSADPRAPLADGLVSTVRFHDALTAALATASPTGAAVVLEVGPGRALSHHATAALAAIPLDPEGTVEGPARAAATLLAHGHPGLALRCAATLAPPLADRAAPTPAAAVAERADTSAPNDPLRSTIIAVITEVTGYEAHHLTPGVSLDADLGVDSVRKMEILGALQDRLGLVVPERALASATSGDLDALVAFVRAHLPAAGAAAPVADAAFVPTDAPALFAWSFVVAPQAGATRVSAVPLPRRSGPTEAAVADALAAWFASPPPSDTPLVLVAPAPGGQLSPDQAAVCAAARCWGRERDQSVRVITYDLDAPHDVVAAERVAARTGDSHVFGDGAVVVRARAPLIPLPPPRLRRVLATGGPGGVVGACLAALAPCDVVVLARTDPSSDSPAAARAREALEALHGVGAACTVIPTDVGDYAAVHAGVAVARTLLGGFDLVLHGAGVLDDRRSEHVDAPSTTRVLAPKVRGATHLIEATRDDAPALWMTLSSLAAETGNVGQSVYAAANAAMEALAHPSATRSCALRTTVWEGVGMGDPAVARALRLVGRAPLTRAQGQAAFLQACAREGVVTCDGTAAVGASALRWSTPGVARSVSLTLQPSADALRDHRVGSNTVVPAALWYELLVELVAATRAAPGPWLTPPPRGAEPIAPVRGFAADRAPLPSSALPRVASDLPTSSEDPTSPLVGAGPVALSEVVVPRATVVRAPQDAVITVNHGEAWVEVDGAPRARAQIGGTPGDAPPIDPAGTGEDASRFYRPDVLFHGATWRVLDRVGARGDAAWATLRATGASPSAAAVDAIHQVAALLLGPSSGHLGLPTGAAAAWFARTRPATRVQVVRTGPWTCDAAAYADDGAAVVVMRGVTLSPAAPWPAAVAAIGEEP